MLCALHNCSESVFRAKLFVHDYTGQTVTFCHVGLDNECIVIGV